LPRPRWDDDERLLAEIADALHEPGPPRPDYEEAGRRAAARRACDLDLELAALTYDSAVDAGRAVSVRSTDRYRTLVFTHPGLTLEVEVTGTDLVGQLRPTRALHASVVGVVGVEGPLGRTTAEKSGYFLLARPTGVVRLWCRQGGLGVVTDWICL
jgi:hypothetical protein